MEKELRREHRGEVMADENALAIERRGCRMKAAFPGAYAEEGCLVSFDLDKIRQQLGWQKPYQCHNGLEFEKHGDEIWISARVEVAGSLGSWTWFIKEEEWEMINVAMNQGKMTRRSMPLILQTRNPSKTKKELNQI